ncbi:MAG: methyltransferase domain-containing protein [Deltaproteobacteria bacterium]|nr:methyltransferase domain-containing protein [Deltaproteobacteria bacterium]
MDGNGQALVPDPKRNGHQSLDVEEAVLRRYNKAAQQSEAGLCVPVNYNRSLLEIIPAEILEKDYGCGDPSKYVRAGETVLDLGSGSGKACFIMAQMVGAAGRVIGVDFNEEMLALSRKYQASIGRKLGYHNVEFRRGRIQNLRLNLALLDDYLKRNPVRSVTDFSRLRDFEEQSAREHPLIPDGSVDLIVSNCVLNLVRSEDKQQLFSEMYRVLRKGGRIAISDIVSDEPVPDYLKNDPELWSGCVSGAFQEEEFFRAFEEAKFYGIHIEDLRSEPYQIIEGIEFRSVTITAHKGKEGPCIDRNQAVIYRGPWKQVVDDDDHVLPRGVRIAVCEKTYKIYSGPPYQDQFVLIPPREEIAAEATPVFDCSRDHRRHPRETKGLNYNATQTSRSVCGPGSACCA